MMEILFFCLYYHISEISKKHILSIIIIFIKGTESFGLDLCGALYMGAKKVSFVACRHVSDVCCVCACFVGIHVCVCVCVFLGFSFISLILLLPPCPGGFGNYSTKGYRDPGTCSGNLRDSGCPRGVPGAETFTTLFEVTLLVLPLAFAVAPASKQILESAAALALDVASAILDALLVLAIATVSLYVDPKEIPP